MAATHAAASDSHSTATPTSDVRNVDGTGNSVDGTTTEMLFERVIREANCYDDGVHSALCKALVRRRKPMTVPEAADELRAAVCETMIAYPADAKGLVPFMDYLQIEIADAMEAPLMVVNSGTAVFKGMPENARGVIIASCAWSDGDYYIGEWSKEARSGLGLMLYHEKSDAGTRHFHGVYYGEWVNGGRTGTGCYRLGDGTLYDGQWLDGKIHGRGRMEFSCGEVYDGMWAMDARDGFGVITHAKIPIKYMGFFCNNQRHGYGYYSANGIGFPLFYRNGQSSPIEQLHTQRAPVCTRVDETATLTPFACESLEDTPAGSQAIAFGAAHYVGEVDAHGRPHGRGVYTGESVYSGQWRHGCRHGRGLQLYSNGDRFDGEWHDDVRSGTGDYTWMAGAAEAMTFRGAWQDDRVHGMGRLTMGADVMREGVWDAGVFRQSVQQIRAETMATGLLQEEAQREQADEMARQRASEARRRRKQRAKERVAAQREAAHLRTQLETAMVEEAARDDVVSAANNRVHMALAVAARIAQTDTEEARRRIARACALHIHGASDDVKKEVRDFRARLARPRPRRPRSTGPSTDADAAAARRVCVDSALLVCPITLRPFRDPVVTDAGITYERQAVEMWFRIGRARDPVTGAAVSRHVVPNLLARRLTLESA